MKTVKKFDNVVFKAANFDSQDFADTLALYGDHGYKLVSVTTIKGEYNIDFMYCFFTKEII